MESHHGCAASRSKKRPLSRRTASCAAEKELAAHAARPANPAQARFSAARRPRRIQSTSNTLAVMAAVPAAPLPFVHSRVSTTGCTGRRAGSALPSKGYQRRYAANEELACQGHQPRRENSKVEREASETLSTKMVTLVTELARQTLHDGFAPRAAQQATESTTKPTTQLAVQLSAQRSPEKNSFALPNASLPENLRKTSAGVICR